MSAENTFAPVVTEPATVPTDGAFTGQLTGDTPPPPPPMPDAATPAPPPAMPTAASVLATAGTPDQPEKTDGWQVDWYELRSFGDAVVRARAYLDAVQAKVDRMQGAELTPQLGTSPVGQQLAKKFDDRLNSVDGLRAMLAEAMKRMDDFVASAETAARAYADNEESTADTFSRHHHHHDHAEAPPVKNGG
jgi:hypothetical protein